MLEGLPVSVFNFNIALYFETKKIKMCDEYWNYFLKISISTRVNDFVIYTVTFMLYSFCISFSKPIKNTNKTIGSLWYA